ncbi:MAG: formylglycine-generating enzyme family protein [Acidobacteria bacterium]|nr:formylglycine-generating enzyme family protein [Acidobacteriota bacterium]
MTLSTRALFLVAAAAALAGAQTPQLVRIPAGEFTMGGLESPEHLSQAFKPYNRPPGYFKDEYPAHRVRITRAFFMGRTEVTVGQFRQFTEATGYRTDAERDGEGGWGYDEATGMCVGRRPRFSWKDPGFPQTQDHPVVNVTWDDALAYCKWLGKLDGKTYRLPTEAEWEYAARAGTTTRYFSGDEPKALQAFANVVDDTGITSFPHVNEIVIPRAEGHRFTAPVASFKPNPWGLYDMAGNVWEWCSDRYGEDAYAHSRLNDPRGPRRGDLRVRRGGAWNSWPLWARSSFRNWNTPWSRCLNLGFRVVRDE